MSNTDFGYGQMLPDDFQSDLNIVAFVCRQMIARLDTMKLVQVKAVHPGQGSPPAAGTVDVLPLVSQIDGNGYAVPHGTVYGLAYWRFQFGPWAIVADPAVGDVGYVICADRDSSAVLRTGAAAAPATWRRYNIADGIYVGGVANAVPTATWWLKSDGTWTVTDKPGNVLQGDSNGITATPVSGKPFTVNGPFTATGLVTGSDFSDGTVTSYKAHTHGGVETGSSQTLEPTAGT